jgi:hypothetical protein
LYPIIIIDCDEVSYNSRRSIDAAVDAEEKEEEEDVQPSADR